VPIEVRLFIPPESVFPGTPATAEVLIEVLATLMVPPVIIVGAGDDDGGGGGGGGGG
jgi:hypothetical protein